MIEECPICGCHFDRWNISKHIEIVHFVEPFLKSLEEITHA